MHHEPYLAHTSYGGHPQLLVEHLRNVAEAAAQFAEAFGAEQEAYLAGILLDLGKYR